MRHIIALAKTSLETGAVCHDTGPYRCAGPVRAVVFFREGQRVPCGPDGQATAWRRAEPELGDRGTEADAGAWDPDRPDMRDADEVGRT